MNLTRKLTALGLTLALILPQTALASDALGHDLHTANRPLSQGTALATGWFWSDTYSDLRTERYLTYTPNTAVTPTVAYGDNVIDKATLTAMAKALESQGKRVVGGTNGDFYVMATGQPLGLVVTDGVVRSSSSYHYAVGFRADGTAFIGQPQLRITATLPTARVNVSGGINKVRQVTNADGGGLTLLTGDFASTTRNTRGGVDVYLTLLTEEVGQSVDVLAPVQVAQPTEVYTIDPDTGLQVPGEPTYVTEMRPTGEQIEVSRDLRIGKRVRCRVDFVTEAAGANPLQKDSLVLTMNGTDDPAVLAQLRALKPGDQVDIDITSSDSRWNEATQALGGMYRLLENGKLGGNLSAERTARTAVGIRPDGTVLFYTVDGKQSGYSVGANCTQVAQRLLELGCTEALGLDGGGSTTIGITDPADDSFSVVNRPSDGAQRANSTALFLTTELKPTGVAGALQLTPGDALVLSDTRLQFSASYLDTAWYAMAGQAQNVGYTATGTGEITPEGAFTAGKAGTTTITGVSGSLSGSTGVTTVETPDKITVTNEATGGAVQAISLEPGETVFLTASSTWRNLAVTSQDSCYTWACDEAVGTVTEDGTFTAGTEGGAGSLTVTAGGKTVTLPVNVAGHVRTLEDFEDDESTFTADEAVDGASTTQVSLEQSLNNVRTGQQSLRVDYTLREGAARLEAGVAIPAGEGYLGLWVKGDGSGNTLSALMAVPAAEGQSDGTTPEDTGDETVSEGPDDDVDVPLPEPTDAPEGERSADVTVLPIATLNFTGWKHFLVALPKGAQALVGMEVTAAGEQETGTVWLDQLTSANAPIEDFNAPLIDLKVEGNTLTAAISDNVDRDLPAGAVKATYDGWNLETHWNAETGVLTATLPDFGTLERRISVTAVDASGNLGRQSLSAGQGPTLLFEDMEDHWAAPCANYLYGQGITKGTSNEGRLIYQPNANITRAEFFTMCARWMHLDTADVELPFADAGDIPAWALDAVKAMYAAGVLQGSLDYGLLKVNPGATITRAEVMTILGRTQSRGYREADLSAFTDVGDVPGWAEAYVRSLVGQGVINGYEDGTVRPLNPMTRGEVAKVLYTLR